MTLRQLTNLTIEEIRLLNAAVGSIDVDEVAGQALYLRVLDGGREWLVEADAGQLTVHVDDPSCVADPGGQRALSERVRRFAECFDDEALSLSVADDSTIVAQSAWATAAIDLVPEPRAEPRTWRVQRSAQVVVSARQFLQLLWSARCLPTGIGDSKYPMPPMWMQFGEGWVGLHVDWHDFLPSRATYRLAARSQAGTTTTAIPHSLMENFLRAVPLVDDDGDDLDLTITVGTVQQDGGEREAVQLSGDGWRMVLWLQHPLGDRWGDMVDEGLLSTGVDVVDRADAEWLVRSGATEVRVKLHAGHPDVARVSAVLVGAAQESLELLRELGQLNAASSGLRYWLEDGTVRVAADVRCTMLGALGAIVHDVARAAATYAPMLAALAVGSSSEVTR